MVRKVETRSAPHAVAVLVGSALYGGITVGGRYFDQLGFSLLEISIMGGLFGTLTLLPALWRRPEWRIQWSEKWLFVAYGLMGTTLQLTQFAAVVLGVPIAIVALLLYTQPVWTVLLGRLWLAEPITRRKLAALALAAIGIVLLVGPTDGQGEHSTIGMAAAAVAGVMLSLWVILARLSALRGNHPVTTTFGYQSSTTLGLFVIWAAMSLSGQQPEMWRLDPGVFAVHWLPVLIYTAAVNLGPNLLVMWGMRGQEASIAGVLLLTEPVAAAILAWLMFGETVTGHVWLGGAFILGANAALVARVPGRRASSGPEPA
ncbi:MAG: EamA family transporter [Acidobacteria bacterium]|nr:EamA family transporter [Acidobacteriota bacterium]